jgi:hypothetical protein
MTSAVAEMVLYIITAVSVVVWVEGLRYLTTTIHKSRKGAEEFTKPDEPAPASIIYGTAEVDGNAAELSQLAATLLVAKSVTILQRTDESVVFQTPGGTTISQTFNMPTLNGQLQFTPIDTQKTRVDYAIARPNFRGSLIAGFTFIALGFIAIVGGFLTIYFLVVPSPFVAVRWQTVQMVQVVHFLWPPFMFGGVYRKSASIIKTQFDTFIRNLPFMKA